MPNNIKNFISYRKMNIKDSVRFALIIFVLLLSFVSWRNQTIAEKIFYGIIVWIYSFIALLYANPENMKEKYKKNKFYDMHPKSWTAFGGAYFYVKEKEIQHKVLARV